MRLANLTGTEFVDNTSIHGTEYWYAVLSVDYAGNENQSVINTSTGAFINGIANDTIVPELPSNIITTNSSNILTLKWPRVVYDVQGNSDFNGLTYELWYKSGGELNTSKNISANGFATISINNESANSTTWDIPTNCDSACNHMFIVTSVDDATNRNISYTIMEHLATWANVSVLYVEQSSSEYTGGSSGGSVTVTQKEDIYSRGWSSIDGNLDIEIDKADIPLTLVKFTFAQKAFNFQFEVRAYSEIPEHLPKLKYPVYNAMKITAKSMEDHTLIRPRIEFKVKNSWLVEKGAGSGDIALYRYADNKWNQLKTTYLSKDSLYSY